MHGRKANSEEREWLALLEQMPCIVCDMFHEAADTPAEIHHLNGQTAPCCHLQSIALCDKHHRRPDNQKPKRWISRHGDGKAAFEARYLPEHELLAYQKIQIELFVENCL